jgi:metal-responsive CopG/Arc/MetJ family transcriptional regulator
MSMALKTERFEMRLETTMIERVDAWRRKQEDLPSRAEAVRRLIELGLSAKKTRAKVKT